MKKSPRKFSKSKLVITEEGVFHKDHLPPGIYTATLKEVTDNGLVFNIDGKSFKPGAKYPARKLSKSLSKRTKLTPEQLARVRGQAGEGLASRYTADGNQSLELTRRLVKAKKRAKKFVLYSDIIGRRVYLSSDTTQPYPLTFDKKEALKFYEGFDDAGSKVTYWNEIFYQQDIRFKTTHE